MRIVALLYALSWVAVRGMLVCGCPASKGGILRAISPAGRRFRASALVSGRKNHDVYAYMCTFFLFAFRHLGFVVGTVRQVFLHSANDLLVPPLGLPLGPNPSLPNYLTAKRTPSEIKYLHLPIPSTYPIDDSDYS